MLSSPHAADDLAATTDLLEVTFDDDDIAVLAPLRMGSLPVVAIGVTRTHDDADAAEWPAVFDVVLDAFDPVYGYLLDAVAEHPIAATALAVLLRESEALDVELALASESAVYSMLQSGPEFAAWRAGGQRTPPAPDTEPAAIGDRDGDELAIELNRPHRHNAFSRSMRDALSELLGLALTDDTIATVQLRGRGPSFSSGGDLGEFGSFSDPASAHRARLTRSPARLVHRLRNRVHVHLHGACMGAGIELAAFAADVRAHPDSRIALPELSLGLIPGAGGTVSLPRRIGRQRTAYLALSGVVIGAERALAWGLIDGIDNSSAAGATAEDT